MKIDHLAQRAKTSEEHLQKLLDRLDSKLRFISNGLPDYVKIMHDQDGCLKSLVWDLVKKYDINCGSFVAYLETNIHFLIKSEHRKVKKYNMFGKRIVTENNRLYKEPYYSLVDLIAERESFYMACAELKRNLSTIANIIFEERVNPSKRTISISVHDSFDKGGSDSPVRMTWKHISKSLKIPYAKVIKIVNSEIIVKADEIFRKFGFCNPYDYRNKKMPNIS